MLRIIRARDDRLAPASAAAKQAPGAASTRLGRRVRAITETDVPAGPLIPAIAQECDLALEAQQTVFPQAVESPTQVGSHSDEAGTAQEAEVLGDRCSAEAVLMPDHFGELPRSVLPAGEELYEPAAHGIGHRLERMHSIAPCTLVFVVFVHAETVRGSRSPLAGPESLVQESARSAPLGRRGDFCGR
nr:hypothetical protein [Microbacterium aoyamense]